MELIMRNQRHIEAEQPTAAWQRLFDLDQIEALLQGTARAGKPISYAETLDNLGFAFSRPKMRALCLALGEIDRRGAEKGQPELAVLVVRASDKLPGAGWWSGRDYSGPYEGKKAHDYVARLQSKTFTYWQKQK